MVLFQSQPSQCIAPESEVSGASSEESTDNVALAGDNPNCMELVTWGIYIGSWLVPVRDFQLKGFYNCY